MDTPTPDKETWMRPVEELEADANLSTAERMLGEAAHEEAVGTESLSDGDEVIVAPMGQNLSERPLPVVVDEDRLNPNVLVDEDTDERPL